VEIRRLGPGDDALVHAGAALFDDEPEAAATARFLAADDHHLLLAFADDRPVGFITGVETTHPDKGTEMFLYELGVDEAFRRRGIGTALVAALRDLAADRGCSGMWVLTDSDNIAALGAYEAAGGRDPQPQIMLEWSFSE
jgi:ribosomal protein S18 acetylase RimI-like enzyme